MTIYIKDMVCVRCKMAVQAVLEHLDIGYISIELGTVKLSAVLSPEQMQRLEEDLKHYQLELVKDRKKGMVERIKALIVEQLHSPESHSSIKLSVLVSKGMNYNYTYLANLFSETEGSTIERYYIESRAERVKELLVYEGLTLNEIAYRLNYSSVSHLSKQFKKVTGKSPAHFKKLCLSDDFIWRPC